MGVGVPVIGRPADGFDKSVGFFSNTFPICVNIGWNNDFLHLAEILKIDSILLYRIQM